VQQALLATKVRRFAIFFASDVPCVLDATDQRYEYIDLTPGGRAFRPELRGSVKGSAYQDIVRVVFFNCSIGTPSAQSINGRDFITSVREPVPPNVCRSFFIKSIQADTNVHRRHLRDVAKQADSRTIDRIARIATRSMTAAGRSTPAYEQMLPLTDVPACMAVLNNIDKHLATTAQLPTTTTASLSACSRHLAACHDASLAGLVLRVGIKVAKCGTQKQQAAALQAFRHVFDTDHNHREDLLEVVITTLLCSIDDDKDLRRRCRGFLSHIIAAEPARSKAAINVRINSVLAKDTSLVPTRREILVFWSIHTHSHAGALVDHDTWTELLRDIGLPNGVVQSTTDNFECWEDPPPPWMPSTTATITHPRPFTTWNVNGFRRRWKSGQLQKSIFKLSADVLHLTETRTDMAHIDSIDEVKTFLLAQGYRYAYWTWCTSTARGGYGYAGSAVFCRVNPSSVSFGLGSTAGLDEEGRIITAVFDDTTMV
jgi:hypothetical protein